MLAVLAVLVVAAAPSTALGDGGPSIAGETPVVYGQQQFGNTANGGAGESHCGGSNKAYRSWWGFGVTSGDQLTIDWESHEKLLFLQAFAIGTTDFTFLTTSPLIEQGVNINFKEQATYAATQTGVLPVEFKSDTGCFGATTATYNFTASVLHAVVLSLPTLTTLPTSGAISVGVHNPDGIAISDPSLLVGFDVEVSGASSFSAVGSAPVANGVATVSYSLPSSDAGHSVTVQAASSGPAYLAGSSSTEVVTVPKPPKPAPCIVPAIRRHETLSQMESALHHSNCAVGTVRRVRSRRYRRGTVIALGPRSGSHLGAQSRVLIVVSRGRH